MGTTPLFFGDAQTPLFGAFHPPVAGGAKRPGVVLCYPAPQEYMFAHRAFRRLAEVLAERGHPVLRFDYTGTGDSSGDLNAATFAGWRTDLRTAADELSELGGVQQISVVGMRLGASLAATVSAEGRRFRDLVLWDPIVNGSKAIAELRAIDEQRLAMSHVKRSMPADELCGFSFPAHLRRELGRLDLLQLPELSAAKVSILTSAEDKSAVALYERLAANGNDVSLRVVPDPEALEKRASLGESLLSRNMIDAVVERIASA
jgi:uncharacterized protein